MNKNVFEDINTLCDSFLDCVNEDASKDVAIVGCYETICDVLNELVRNGIDIISCELHDPEYDGYEEAYYIEVARGGIWCGKMQYEGHDYYLQLMDDVIYVEEYFIDEFLESFNSNDSTSHVVIFGFDNFGEDDEVPCLCFDDDYKGFSFCMCDDGYHLKFKYKGSKKLTMDEAWKIISENFN